MIIYTAAAHFYIPFNMTCTCVLVLTIPFMYFTRLLLCHFVPYPLSLLWDAYFRQSKNLFLVGIGCADDSNLRGIVLIVFALLKIRRMTEAWSVIPCKHAEYALRILNNMIVVNRHMLMYCRLSFWSHL